MKKEFLTCAQKLHDKKLAHSRKAILCMTANRPLARFHILSFISGGGRFSRLSKVFQPAFVDSVSATSQSVTCSKKYCHTRKAPSRRTPMTRRAMIYGAFHPCLAIGPSPRQKVISTREAVTRNTPSQSIDRSLFSSIVSLFKEDLWGWSGEIVRSPPMNMSAESPAARKKGARQVAGAH